MAKSGDTVWVTWAESESGDDYGRYVLAHEPSNKELEEFWRERAESEFPVEDDEGELDEGPGDWGSWLHVRVEECVIE
jgi:hypothetical protein